MKSKLFTLILIGLLAVPLSTSFGFIGFGALGLSEMGSADAGTYTEGSGLTMVTMDRDGFDGVLGVGGYLYLDFIPIVDLEFEFQAAGAEYDFQFGNQFIDLDQPFGWARASGYITARKNLLKFGVPVLGGIKLQAGGGLNFHSSTPLASIDMVETLLGGDLVGGDLSEEALKDNLKDYLKENKIDASGLHFQVGVQIKLLALDTFLFYRLTMAKDVYADQDSFGSLNLRLGFGL